jgi:transcriptional coactivator HFI1/ADA1
LARSNFDIEIRRRYAQPLASEQLEFPNLADVQNRIEPICYEEGLTGGLQQGALQGCAELIEQATEVYVKEMLGNFLGHARGNAAGREGVQTHKFKKQLRKEEDDFERGVLQRNAGGLLPAEMEMQAKREPLKGRDLRLSLGLSDMYLRQDRFLSEKIVLSHYPELDRDTGANGHLFGDGGPLVNGIAKTLPPDPNAMDIDGADYGMFQGTSQKDRDDGLSALEDCLLAAG